MRASHPLLVLFALSVAGATHLALAAPGRRAPDADADAAPPARPTTPPERPGPLFRGDLPLDLGKLPQGLANPSAQGCHACHTEPYDGWAGSAHARGVTPALAEAAAEAGTPACLSCHLPLQQQHPHQVTFQGGDPTAPLARDNPAWSPTLQAEGVTCVACHVRDGAVVGPRPPTHAPHTTAWSSVLSSSSMCAACHQLTWPGASAPFYDTFGEWERSAWAKAGVSCQDCHMGPGAGAVRTGADHAIRADLGRAVSVLVDLSAPVLVRGGDPVTVTLTVQNTGAGHAVPTGSPLTGLRLTAGLLAADATDLHEVALSQTLGQTVGTAAPWPITDDTRIAAGDSRTYTFEVQLPYKAEPGTWAVAVRLERTLRDEVVGPVQVERTVPITVE